ncbi:unnamed protein product, partial [Owenia fusiformis]
TYKTLILTRCFTSDSTTIMLLVLCLALVALGQAEHKSYEGYQVITINPTTADDVRDVVSLVADRAMKASYWQDPVAVLPFDVMVAPETALVFVEALIYKDIQYTIAVSNVQRFIEREEASRARGAVSQEEDPVNYILSDYQRHDTINAWLNDMGSQYAMANVNSIGSSYEGRDMRAIAISGGSGRPAIVIDCALHAREWITVPTCIYAIQTLLTQYNSNADVRAMVDSYDWHFLPVANPDGYEYTHTSDRMWRKTRSPTNDVLCTGTDANRNFDAFWGEAGVDFDPCSDVYPGSRAFSEIETQNIRDWIQSIPSKRLYLNVHSYTQLWLTPWGYNPNERYPADYAELERVATLAMAGLRSVNGREFIVGTPPDILYPASGGAYDWAKASAGVKYSYAPELRPASAIEGGFILDTTHIMPSGREVFEALRIHAEEMRA